MNKNILIIRIILWLILAVAVGWFAYMKIRPSGRISHVYNFKKPSYFIGKLTPAGRVEASENQAVIKGGPVYFSLKTPRRFERAKVSVKFKNTTDFPVMEIGLLNNKASWSYDLKPLQNKIIDQLSLAWPAVSGENGVRLIEREKKYKTVEQFLGNLPNADEIALYNYTLKNNFSLANYESGRQDNLIDYKFRGSYQFYTYVKQEQLDYIFDFVNFNVNQNNNNPIAIKVYSPDGLIYSADAADKKEGESKRQAVIKIADLPEAAYRFSIIADDDIITKSIITKQSRFILINKVWLAEGNKANLALFTNSRLVNAQTANPASLGKIKIGDAFLDLNETYKQRSVKILNRTAKIELPKDDIIISGDGVFSFTENGWFDPRFKNLSGNFNLNEEKINYVLTVYQTPLSLGDWQTAAAEFDLTKAYQEQGKYQFLISIPSFKAEEPVPGGIIIKEIKIDLQGTDWRKKFKKYFYGLP